MKKYFFITICTLSLSFITCDSSDDSSSGDDDGGVEESDNRPRTTISDINFEQAIVNAGADDVVDGSVVTANLANVINLIAEESAISNVSGIEKMPNLETLNLRRNAVSDINFSGNPKLKFIFLDENAITQLDVSNLPILEKLTFDLNTVSTINVSANPSLEQLEFESNKVLNIDVSNNGALSVLNTVGNPALCIQVSEAQLNEIPNGWVKDDDDTYALICN